MSLKFEFAQPAPVPVPDRVTLFVDVILSLPLPKLYTNWASLYAALLRPGAEVAIVGAGYETFRAELSRHFLPFDVLAGATAAGLLPLLQGRGEAGTTTLYVCRN